MAWRTRKMTKFEEELFDKVKVANIELTTEAEYKKTTLINHFKNWHSDEEFQDMKAIGGSFALANQNLIDDNKKLVKEIANLKSQLQQQSLPVVPECVAEWIDKNISVAHNAELMIHNILICAIDNKNRYLFPLEVEKFVLKNPITFLNAVITDKYEVEKPQLFYLREKNTNYYLNKSKNNGLELVPNPYFDEDNQFTKQEIDSMQTGSYELVPVEEGK